MMIVENGVLHVNEVAPLSFQICIRHAASLLNLVVDDVVFPLTVNL
jgi:hypothetical protein